MRAWQEARRAAAAAAVELADFDFVVADVVFSLRNEHSILSFRFHIRTDGGFHALHEVGLFRLRKPIFHLGGVALALFGVLHFAYAADRTAL